MRASLLLRCNSVSDELSWLPRYEGWGDFGTNVLDSASKSPNRKVALPYFIDFVIDDAEICWLVVFESDRFDSQWR